MKYTKNGIFRFLCGLAAMFTLSVGIAAAPVLALSGGVYTAQTHPHYKHPVTGKIEDVGNNPVLGQSMTETLLQKKALFEVDSNGKKYITVRYNLMDNVKNVKFFVQKKSSDSFSPVSVSVMKEDLAKNTTDFRFQVPSENVIVRSTVFVTPMGREVVYYMNFSDFQKGKGDFIVSVTETDKKKDPPKLTNHTAPKKPKVNTEKTSVKPQESKTVKKDDKALKSKASSYTSKLESKLESSAVSSQKENSAESLAESKATKTESSQINSENPKGNKNKKTSTVLAATLICTAVAVLVGVVMVYYRRRKNS